jgi:phage baseplate assembly protein gpV
MGFQSANDTVAATEKYGEGYYLGTVTINVDPEGLHRVQANVPNLYDTTKGEVPWIGAHTSSPFGFGVGPNGAYGTYGSPYVGSNIKVELQNGDEHNGLYSPIQVAAAVNADFTDPNVWGFKDPDGNVVKYDMTNHTYTFTTKGGATINIDANGKRVTAVNGDVETSNGDWQINVTGNAGISASGNAVVSANGNVSLSAGGTASYKAAAHNFMGGPVSSDNDISAAGNMTDLTASGNTKTVGNMRTIYDEHDHQYDDNGNESTTSVPNQQI